MTSPDSAINLVELRRYLGRIGDRWPLEKAVLGGAKVADERGALPQRERGPEFIVVLVSEAFDGVPWLERVYQAGSLWDDWEMGAPADVHCYTASELERRVDTNRRVRETMAGGMELPLEASV
jgi:uncharacterized protein